MDSLFGEMDNEERWERLSRSVDSCGEMPEIYIGDYFGCKGYYDLQTHTIYAIDNDLVVYHEMLHACGLNELEVEEHMEWLGIGWIR